MDSAGSVSNSSRAIGSKSSIEQTLTRGSLLPWSRDHGTAEVVLTAVVGTNAFDWLDDGDVVVRATAERSVGFLRRAESVVGNSDSRCGSGRPASSSCRRSTMVNRAVRAPWSTAWVKRPFGRGSVPGSTSRPDPPARAATRTTALPSTRCRGISTTRPRSGSLPRTMPATGSKWPFSISSSRAPGGWTPSAWMTPSSNVSSPPSRAGHRVSTTPEPCSTSIS